MKTETVARNLVKVWMAQFGVFLKITTDRCRPFESFLFRDLNNILGIDHAKITSYHLQANGILERWNRRLLCAIKPETRSINCL